MWNRPAKEHQISWHSSQNSPASQYKLCRHTVLCHTVGPPEGHQMTWDRSLYSPASQYKLCRHTVLYHTVRTPQGEQMNCDRSLYSPASQYKLSRHSFMSCSYCCLLKNTRWPDKAGYSFLHTRTNFADTQFYVIQLWFQFDCSKDNNLGVKKAHIQQRGVWWEKDTRIINVLFVENGHMYINVLLIEKTETQERQRVVWWEKKMCTSTCCLMRKRHAHQRVVWWERLH